MQKSFISFFKIIVILVLGAVISTRVIYAEPIKIGQLLKESTMYDSSTVIVEGEVIGDIMKRGSHVWINILDDEGSIGVYLTIEEANKITYSGNNRFKGDIIKIKGIFNGTCKEHGGDIDIHADQIEVMTVGYKVVEHFVKTRFILGVVLIIIALIIYILNRHLGHYTNTL